MSSSAKKPPRKKKPQPRRNKSPQGKGLRRWLLTAGLALLLLMSLLATAYFVFLRPVAPPEVSRPVTRQTPSVTPQKKPPTEPRTPAGADSVGLGAKAPVSSAAPSQTERIKPKIAIVIDDMGYRQDTGNRLLNMKLELSFSFLPFAPHSKAEARQAQKLGHDVLLHLPLEPTDSDWNLGPGGLYVAMDKKKQQTVFARDLAFAPMAIGVNNHMGSRFTADRRAMKTLLGIIAEHKMFFLDSITTPDSLGYELARSMGVRAARRHIFLDNDQEPDKIVSQLESMVSMAEKYGWAVGLAHPYPATLTALQEYEPQLDRRVRLVRISELVK